MTTATISPSTEPVPAPAHKPFRIGTAGWTARDLDRPEVAEAWERGRYEIVERVMTELAAALAYGTGPTGRLFMLIGRHIEDRGLPASVHPELDLQLSPTRVLVAVWRC